MGNSRCSHNSSEFFNFSIFLRKYKQQRKKKAAYKFHLVKVKPVFLRDKTVGPEKKLLVDETLSSFIKS